MKPFEFLKKTNTVLIFILLVGAITIAGYLIVKLQKPMDTVHVAVDSLHVGKKQK
jgi:hypothetical protein